MIRHTPMRRQSGAVLIVALLFLVVLTMLGVTAMTGTTFEERMAGNARDSAVARHAAEAGLRTARNMLLGIAKPHGTTLLRTEYINPSSPGGVIVSNFKLTADTDPNGLCVEGFCSPRSYTHGQVGVVPPDVPAGVNWSENVAPGATTEMYAADGTTGALQALSKQPRFIIELFCLPLPGGGINGQSDDCRVYRFTSVGWGKNPNTQVTVQEFYVYDPNLKTN